MQFVQMGVGSATKQVALNCVNMTGMPKLGIGNTQQHRAYQVRKLLLWDARGDNIVEKAKDHNTCLVWPHYQVRNSTTR